MTLFILSIVLAVVTTVWVVYPIVAHRSAAIADVEHSSVLDAEARRRVALASLTEVEYDREAGKLDEGDYVALREQLAVEAVQAMRAADNFHHDDTIQAPAAVHACGYANAAGSRFCAGCGARLS